MATINIGAATLSCRRSSLYLLVLLPCILILSYFSFNNYRPTWSILPPDAQKDVLIPELPNNSTGSAHILLVSAFFPLSKSKHTMSDYSSWLSRFLTPITTDIYFFAPPDMESLIRELRGPLPITINTTYSSPFDIPPLTGLQDKYAEMHKIDREKDRHSPELYAVWAGKAFFLDEGLANAKLAGQEYEYAFWNDAGSFRREHKYVQWPDGDRVKELWQEGASLNGVSEDELIFFPIWDPPHASMKYWTENMGPVDNEFSEGSFFGGRPASIAWWRRVYYTYHDYYLADSVFVGKDQTLINALILLHPQRFITVWIADPLAPNYSLVSKVASWWDSGEGPLGKCGSTWFYYQWWLASENERKHMREQWGGSKWWPWGGRAEEERCRDTRLLGMVDLLKRVFGNGWKPPTASISVEVA